MAQFDHCKKAEIPAIPGRPALRCKVGTLPTGGLLISVPRDFKCSSGKPVEVVFFDPLLGLTRCSCRLSAPVPKGDLCFYRCEVLETISKKQRREDLKVEVNVPVKVQFGGAVWPATVANLSAGGVLLISTLSARPGNDLVFQFSEAGERISLTARVLRVELRPPQKGKISYGYGCKFVNLSPGHESLLRNYVFQEERRLYSSNNPNG